MITTIYNILILIISFLLIATQLTNAIQIWYSVLCIGAIVITMCIRRPVNLYPNIGYKHREAVEIAFGEKYQERFINYIGSFACHFTMLLIMTQNYPLLVAISGVFFLRMYLLIDANRKIREQK